MKYARALIVFNNVSHGLFLTFITGILKKIKNYCKMPFVFAPTNVLKPTE
jgi:hypothetical protein